MYLIIHLIYYNKALTENQVRQKCFLFFLIFYNNLTDSNKTAAAILIKHPYEISVNRLHSHDQCGKNDTFIMDSYCNSRSKIVCSTKHKALFCH